MGAASKKIQKFIKKTETVKIQDFKDKQENYKKIHSKCDLLIARDLNDKITEIEESSMSTIFSRVQTSFAACEGKIKEAGITTEDYYEVMFNTVTIRIIKTHFQIPRYNIFKIIPSYANKLIYQDEKIPKIKVALEYFAKEFEEDMLSIVYNLKDDIKTLENPVLFGLNRNLKFNEDYQPKILNIILTPWVFKNEELINDLAELIENGEKLQIVSIIIHPIDEDGNLYENYNLTASNQIMLNRLLIGVSKNRLIKGLFIHCSEEYKITIAPETSNLIINKLQSETLVAFHLGKFELSDDLFNNLLFQLTSTRSMLFFSLDTKKIWRVLLNKILPAVIPNTSLIAIALTGFKLSVNREMIEEFEKRLTEKNKIIDLIYCGEESVVKYPFPLS